MINVERGSILIGHGLLIDKDFTFEKFKESHLYDGQDGIRKIDLIITGNCVTDGGHYGKTDSKGCYVSWAEV